MKKEKKNFGSLCCQTIEYILHFESYFSDAFPMYSSFFEFQPIMDTWMYTTIFIYAIDHCIRFFFIFYELWADDI